MKTIRFWQRLWCADCSLERRGVVLWNEYLPVNYLCLFSRAITYFMHVFKRWRVSPFDTWWWWTVSKDLPQGASKLTNVECTAIWKKAHHSEDVWHSGTESFFQSLQNNKPWWSNANQKFTSTAGVSLHTRRSQLESQPFQKTEWRVPVGKARALNSKISTGKWGWVDASQWCCKVN